MSMVVSSALSLEDMSEVSQVVMCVVSWFGVLWCFVCFCRVVLVLLPLSGWVRLFTGDLLYSCLGHSLVDESLRVSVKWDFRKRV